ncbi:hypothetical protein DEQ92_05785 [Haloferax sp. Atlit-6N]|nr:hypothetical protein DEQ92_05785 [Haloferax sp. Atlit-6N]
MHNKEALTDLDDEVLFQLPAQLINIQKVQITADHTTFWKYTAERVRDFDFTETPISGDVVEHFETAVSLVLVRSNATTDEHVRKIVQKSDAVASYLVYPVLEGVAKRYCHEYVSEDGAVKEGKTVVTYCGDKEFGDEINQVGYLLHHIENVAGSDALREELYKMRVGVREFYDTDENEEYGVINGFRNSWLHGEDEAKAEYGTILSYTALLLWAMMLEK